MLYFFFFFGNALILFLGNRIIKVGRGEGRVIYLPH